MKLYFTVDVETSMGGAWGDPSLRPLPSERRIFCPVGDEMLGVPRICDLLEKYSFKGTFFVDTLAADVNGEDDCRPAFDLLLKRGQDVQLHAHPNFFFYARYLKSMEVGAAFDRRAMSDFFSRLPGEVQREVLERARELFIKLAGRTPVCFRAGSFAANRETLRILSDLGFKIDSSFSACYRNAHSFPGERMPVNEPVRMENIWVIPATVAKSPLPEGPEGFKMADISTISNREMIHLLEEARNQGLRHAVLLLHSFSLVKPRDVRYSQMRLDRVVMGRLDRMFAWLARNSDRYTVSTLNELAANRHELEEGIGLPAPVLPLGAAMRRKITQAVNRLYWV
jgi:peptidoglycan/xylan/chitin deacetylase (PgdA/CDA1 family)